MAEYSRAYYWKNVEKRREYYRKQAKKYRQRIKLHGTPEQKERMRLTNLRCQRRWQSKNRQKTRDNAASYRSKNLEKERKRQREYKKKRYWAKKTISKKVP